MTSWLPWVRRRERLRATPLPPDWRAVVTRNVPLVASLDPERERKLEGLVQVFLDEKSFEGCGGLEITDEIRVTIAAAACLLLVGLDADDPYPGLWSIRVYPDAVLVPQVERDGLVVHEGSMPSIGVSNRRGYVVLSWAAARRPRGGHNVVLHEFAHQLDTQDGSANGAPILPDNLYRPWAKILGAAYAKLLEDVEAHRPSVLDPYGATNAAEFFAVAVEAFFERSAELLREQPALYDVLKRYFGQDPAATR